ncbi:MAG: 50S ribosomal protein L37ae [Candidatus Woesearchaeota archaeon]
MAEQKKKFGSVKRFGPRYGRRLKEKLADVEKKSKKPNKCPFCKNLSAKRIAAGIWKCKKCNSKFASGAYYIEQFFLESSATKEAEEKVVLKSKKTTEEAT